jgi:hypothetical protein
VALPRGRASASPGLGPYDAPPPCASPSCSSSPRKTPSRPSRLRSKSRARHRGLNSSSTGGHYDVYEGGAGFADVLPSEVDLLQRHATAAA